MVRRPTFGPPKIEVTTDLATTGGAGPGIDASLASYANFTILVDSPFRGGPSPGVTTNGYNRETHRYDPQYIRPTGFDLRLDARLGIDINRPQVVARMVKPGRRVATTIGEMLDELGPPDVVVPDPSGELVPDNITTFHWVVSEIGGTYSDAKIVQRPVSPMTLAVFRVPRVGRYNIRLRVLFDDGRTAERNVQFTIRDWFFVSIGDSSASGQGNPDGNASLGLGGGTVCRNTTLALMASRKPNLAMDPIWTERLAWRSLRSGHGLAARTLQYILGQTWSPDGNENPLDFDKIVFASFARSGAEILTGLIAPQAGDDDFIGVGQIEECRRTAAGRRIDVLMVNIGGNDLGFAGVLRDLVAKDSVFRKQLRFIGTGDDSAARQEIERKLDRMLGVGLPPGQFGDLEVRFNTLRDQFDNLREDPGLGEVYIGGYPTSLFEVFRDGAAVFRACGVFEGPDLDISPSDGASIKERGLALNALIKRKAEEFGWHFIDVEADFAGRGYCAPTEETFWVGAEQSCEWQGDFEGMMHPNSRGHAAYGLRFSEAIRDHTLSRRKIPDIGRDPVVLDTTPPLARR